MYGCSMSIVNGCGMEWVVVARDEWFWDYRGICYSMYDFGMVVMVLAWYGWLWYGMNGWGMVLMVVVWYLLLQYGMDDCGMVWMVVTWYDS